MDLERTLGLTALSNASLSVNQTTKTVAFPCGSVVTEYSPKKNRQLRFYTCTQSISCVVFGTLTKANGTSTTLLAIGQRGSKSALDVWECDSSGTQGNATGSKLLFSGKGQHRFGIACAAFSSDGRYVASAGFKNDKKFVLWDVLRKCAVAKGVLTVPPSISASATKSSTGSATAVTTTHAMAFNSALQAFVTAGSYSSLNFWYLGDVLPRIASAAAKHRGKNNRMSSSDVVVAFEPKPAVFGDKLGKGPIVFADVSCGKKSSGSATSSSCESYTFTLTTSGILCCFNAHRLPFRWVGVRVQSGHCLDVTERSIFVGGSDATIREFEPASLRYVQTLAKMKIQKEIYGVNTTAFQWPTETGDKNAATVTSAKTKSDVEPAVICLKSIPGTNRLLAVYGDRSVFVFDLAEKLKMYRSFLNHTGAVWDLVMVPYTKTKAISNNNNSAEEKVCVPAGSFLSCGSDSTVRFWTLDRNRSTYEARCEMWKHSYSRDMLRVCMSMYSQCFYLLVLLFSRSLLSLWGGHGHHHRMSSTRLLLTHCVFFASSSIPRILILLPIQLQRLFEKKHQRVSFTRGHYRQNVNRSSVAQPKPGILATVAVTEPPSTPLTPTNGHRLISNTKAFVNWQCLQMPKP